jgi:hypothetical protein
MNRTTPLPLLIVIAFVLPLVAAAQTDTRADADVETTRLSLPQAAASTASVAGNVSGGSDDQAFQQAAAAERQRIADGRAAATTRYEQDRRDCWQRFAVNACLDLARERRRATLGALRHDELVLNAQERQRRTAARLNEIASKQANNAQRNGSALMPASSASGGQ